MDWLIQVRSCDWLMWKLLFPRYENDGKLVIINLICNGTRYGALKRKFLLLVVRTLFSAREAGSVSLLQGQELHHNHNINTFFHTFKFQRAVYSMFNARFFLQRLLF